MLNGKQFCLLQITSLFRLDCKFTESKKDSIGENNFASSANNNNLPKNQEQWVNH
jgi:hypothetical protein